MLSTRRNTHRIAVALLAPLIVAIPCAAQQRSVAVTFDDLPIAGDIGPTEARFANTAILDSLDRHHVPAIGFVIENRVKEIGEKPGADVLSEWVKRGYDLGNTHFRIPS